MTTQEIGTTSSTGPLNQTDELSTVSNERLIVDGARDVDVTVFDSATGASSEAPVNSGIPSAVRQQRIHDDRGTDGQLK